MSAGGAGVVSGVRVRAFAKINLDLRVVGVRPDGYHEIETVFQSLALHDTLSVEPLAEGRGLTLECATEGVPLDERNLVWQAAERLSRAIDRPGRPNLRFTLDKVIPSAAGLGGGSSDAAAALRALSRLWALPAESAGRLGDVARSLGADVPYFLIGGTALGRGRGDELTPLPDLPPAHVVLVRPDLGVATAEAYGWFDADSVTVSAAERWPQAPSGWSAALASCRNDLQGPVVARHREIDELIGALVGAGAGLAAMTGSGSAVFALFADEADALAAAERVTGHGRHVWLTRTVDGAEYDREVAPESLAG